MKGGTVPNKAQYHFYSELCEMGCFRTGGHAEIHHVVGSSKKQEPIEEFGFERFNIGNWFVLSLNDGPHRNWAINITTNPKRFFDEYRKEKKESNWTDLDCQVNMFLVDQREKYKRVYERDYPLEDKVIKSIRMLGSGNYED